MAEYLIDTTDYRNRRVVLHTSLWNVHIARRHPEVRASLSGIEPALKQPDMVYVAKDSIAHLYYRLGAASRFPLSYLVVLVGYGAEPACVLTIYVTREPSGSVGRLIHVEDKPRH